MYSPVRVSTLILSPWLTNRGTATVSPVSSVAGFEVPVAVWLSRAIGVKGVWIAYPVTFCAMMLLQMAFYLLVWRKKAIRRMV